MAVTMMSEPAEDNNATRKALYNSLPPNMKRLADEWLRREKRSVDGSLDTFYWQARQVAAVSKNPEDATKTVAGPGTTDGRLALDALFDVLGIDNVRRVDFKQVGLHITADMVAKVKSHNETVQPGSITISKTHLIKLAAIGDDSMRDSMLDRAITEGLSATRLQSEITRMLRIGEVTPPDKRHIQAIRPTALVGSVQKRLTSLLEVSEQLLSEEFTERVEAVKGRDLATLNERIAGTLEQLAKVSLVVRAAEIRLTSAKTEADRRFAKEKADESTGTGDPSPTDIQKRMNAKTAETAKVPASPKAVILKKVPNPLTKPSAPKKVVSRPKA